jgi:hypothetical protein
MINSMPVLRQRTDFEKAVDIKLSDPFIKFKRLKVPGGKDKFSSMRLPKLLNEFGGATLETIKMYIQNQKET